ncbi:MAG: DUF5597 domain-containing protein [Eubacteriales bacterium]|nr:DUF5597 domain-containing protein [Eubacteriales bacterium]
MKKHTCFTVQGKPFFSVGAQLHNSTGYAIGAPEGREALQKDRERAFESLEALGVNTVAVPVCWDAFEPKEGVFDLDYVRRIIDRVRERGLHAVLLWFATWKNGQMEYAPVWVKRDRERFVRVRCVDGRETTVMSPFYEANREQDKRAFVRLMELLKEYDGQEQTVIAVQVENEPGMLAATIRDFSEKGTKSFLGGVPDALIGAARAECLAAEAMEETAQKLAAAGQYCGRTQDRRLSPLAQSWAENGRRESGSWAEVFGALGAEFCTAWAIARYIDDIAAAGKQVYDLFLYVNVWMDRCGNRGWSMAGLDYPSGGAVSKVLEVWETACSHLDAFAPDIYEQEPGCIREAQELYDRRELAFYVPESGLTNVNASMMFEAVGKHRAIGYHVFAAESSLDENGQITEAARGIRHSFAMLRSAETLLAGSRPGMRVHTLVQQPGQDASRLQIGDWLCRVSYAGASPDFAGWVAMDCRHGKDLRDIGRIPMSLEEELARGLLFEMGGNEFYLVGHKVRLYWQKSTWTDGSIPVNMLNIQHQAHNMEFLCLEEGHFEGEGFVTDRIRSGDEARHGIWAQYDCGVIHFVLN